MRSWHLADHSRTVRFVCSLFPVTCPYSLPRPVHNRAYAGLIAGSIDIYLALFASSLCPTTSDFRTSRCLASISGSEQPGDWSQIAAMSHTFASTQNPSRVLVARLVPDTQVNSQNHALQRRPLRCVALTRVTADHGDVIHRWQWRNFFTSAVFRHFVGQALRNVCYSDDSRRYFLNKIAIVRTCS